jgi:hypothetical protein
MIITTAKGTKFDTSKPAKSNICMVLDNQGRQVMDTLRITGNQTEVSIFMEKTSMVEVEHSFGVDEICEDYLWQ